MKKIIVIGCPGSGKSTLSKQLHNKTGIPIFHLDMLYWNPDKTTVDKQTFFDRLSKITKGDEWIIDGNYASTMNFRMSACDTVIFLDYPSKVCIDGVRKRMGIPREDIPWIENEEDPGFIEFIKKYNTESKPLVLKLLKEYSYKEIHVLKSRKDAEDFINKL